MIPACLPPRDVSRPDRATQQCILVTNPAKLYGFPN
jgi:hypothetical protein